MSWTESLLKNCTKETRIFISQESKMLAQASKDFGQLLQSSAAAVALPQTALELQALLRFANQHQLSLTPRGFGLSQSGQTLSPQGAITLDLSRLQEKFSVEPEALKLTCQGSASWREVVEKLKPYQLIPKVIPLNPDLTVAGTISIGGIGATSHRYGTIIDNVLGLKVFSGQGEEFFCSAQQEAALFHASLAGLGRCSLITEVSLALRKYKPRVKTFFLLYDDHEQWLRDQESLIQAQRADYLEAFCSASAQGLRQTPQGRKPFAQWFYCLQVSLEYENTVPRAAEILQGLSYWKLVHEEEMDTVEYTARYAPRFALMHQTGAWNLAHPWVEALLPRAVMPALLPRLLEALPLALGDGHRLLHVAESKDAETLFMTPQSSKPSLLFAVLPLGVLPVFLPEVLEALQEVHGLLLQAGGKRYLSGWLPEMDEPAWQEHYGKKYPTWLAAKKKYDPHRVLRSVLLPS